MWPKVLAQLLPQLFELLPHLRRVVPMAEKFLTSKAEADRANEAALASMAEGMRGDLGQVVSAHTGLYRKMAELEELVTGVGVEAKRARMGVDSIEARVGGLEKSAARYRLIAIISLVLLMIVLVLLVLVVLQLHVR